MKISEKGIQLIKDLEGMRLTAYRCSANVLTIGYGHTSDAGSPTVVPGMKITKDEADRILRRDVAYFEGEISPLIKADLDQGQWDAVVCFVFNVGVGAFRSSGVLRKINAGRLDEVPAELMKWTKYTDPADGQRKELKGLVLRRRDECAMWRSLDDDEDVREGDTRLPPVPPAPKKTVTQSKEATASIATSMGGAIAAANEMKKQIDDASGLVDAFTKAMHNPSFVMAAAIVLLGLAIFWWRRQRLLEDTA